jgi:hypothetical protein
VVVGGSDRFRHSDRATQAAMARSAAGAPQSPAARDHRGVMRFLIDECLGVDLVAVAGEAGHEPRHVAHIGRAGWKDWNVTRYAREGDFILVTNNASVWSRGLWRTAGPALPAPGTGRCFRRGSFTSIFCDDFRQKRLIP